MIVMIKDPLRNFRHGFVVLLSEIDKNVLIHRLHTEKSIIYIKSSLWIEKENIFNFAPKFLYYEK